MSRQAQSGADPWRPCNSWMASGGAQQWLRRCAGVVATSNAVSCQTLADEGDDDDGDDYLRVLCFCDLQIFSIFGYAEMSARCMRERPQHERAIAAKMTKFWSFN